MDKNDKQEVTTIKKVTDLTQEMLKSIIDKKIIIKITQIL